MLNLTPGFNGLGKDKYKMTREAFTFWYLERLILETWRYLPIIAPEGYNGLLLQVGFNKPSTHPPTTQLTLLSGLCQYIEIHIDLPVNLITDYNGSCYNDTQLYQNQYDSMSFVGFPLMSNW